ncbi:MULTISPECIES: TlpA disulfide reductase family protein [unclassified Campylobacter]|uniref:TlpA family protein disulfide reductase n=1 Tax=unclassified Campylobacter TaxID=2593542 RepID=UPI001BDABBE8|nr:MULTISPECIES: TlpA disulfide reductase family protein [unclassified Campylobacter]MBZ7975432.1 TlpA family protein disulfide reductase [Campylobacter sp. RM12637]MBZ7977265.1 TlpA family protein disulfide reductase [Campylobacter sp. RM12654]MBZ7979161.1 TlpA family protein disulfide reductase [Campylobacter sp. RM12642]MBZ7981777.1 TlpA family protein disulfide reductase [Campylobacter sp. RM12640]MBZ7983171.1 TlpA family protein disulfide reductase [Campylobacter sp. RM12647]MBZ7988655.1
MKAILLSVALLFFTACFDKKEDKKEEESEQITQVEVKKEPDFNRLIKFSLKFYNSDEIFEIKRINNDNKDLEFTSNDKIILFNFFTTWCPPCKAEIPHLNDLALKYKDRLRVIGVLLEDKSDEEIAKFIKDNGISYDIVTGDNNYTFLKVLGEINGIPYIALYDQNGKNINNYLGAVYEEMLDIDIQKVMK